MTVVLFAAAGTSSPALAGQAAPAAQAPTSPWIAEVGIGFDNSISGNINSSGIGQLNNQTTVITKNTYESVYGTGLHFRFGGGYKLDEVTEVRATFSIQSLDADLTPMGEIGPSNLYGQYTDYQVFSLDVGLRRYVNLTNSKVRPYGEATIGLGFIDETDVTLVAPQANVGGLATDFYDQTAAFTLGVHAGAVVQASPRVGVFVQGGFRWVSGMSAVDNLEGTGLETINDKSARWTFPFLVGVRFGF